MADANIEEIKNRLDVVDVLSSYIQLKKSGTSFKAVCPFHNEKSPSLMVSPQKQIWHCFGCNEGGDIFSFVQKYENLDFRDSLKLLADKAGVVLEDTSSFARQDSELKDRLLRINRFAAEFYHRQLLSASGKMPMDYLMGRGLNGETIKQWQIGFAPDDFHALEKALSSKQVSHEDMVKAGVLVQGEKRNFYDRFRNRITFPIFNYLGDVVGFSARTLEKGQDVAKYINSPETLVYNKSKVMFGLNFAKSEIRKSDNVVIVEGQMDVIMPHQSGFKNIVASSGTALTLEHLRTLKKLTKNLKFCFDSDQAGMAASRRAGELALSEGFAVKVVSLPSGKDPDELVRKDVSSWKKALTESVWFVDYYIEQGLKLFSSNSLEQKKYLSSEVVPLLGFVVDPLEREHFLKKISQNYGVSEQVLVQQLSSIKAQSSQETPREIQTSKVSNNSSTTLEKQVLGGLLWGSESFSHIKEVVSSEDFINPEIKELVTATFEGVGMDKNAESVLAKEALFMVESELSSLGGNQVALINELLKNAYLLRLASLKRKQSELTQQIRAAELSKDSTRLESLKLEFAKLGSLRVEFENKIENPIVR